MSRLVYQTVRRVLPWIAALTSRLRRKRVPVILQPTPYDCGAACLVMILGALGKRVRVRDCHECAGAARDGTNAAAIARCGRRFGLEVSYLELDTVSPAAVLLPAILHWNGNHFVVLERWTPRAAVVVIPPVGACAWGPRNFAGAGAGWR
jgi:ATP-binding cassette, subfamily B, bacterial